MFDFLEQLRRKPLAYRKRLAVFGATALTAVVVVVWLSTWSGFDSGAAIDSKAASEQLKPLEEIKNSIGTFYDSIKTMSAGIFNPSATSSMTDLNPPSQQ